MEKELTFTDQEKIILSVVLYCAGIVLCIVFPDQGLWWSLIILSLLMKDVFQYFVSLVPMKVERTDLMDIQGSVEKGKTKIRYYLSVINRIYVFPVILSGYLLYLLIDQTQLRNLHITIFFQVISSRILLLITILSGVFLIYKEELDRKYTKTISSMGYSYVYAGISIFLGFLSTYIVFNQTHQEMGILAMILSIVSGFLVFLVGLLLIEEDDFSSEVNSM